MARYYLVGDPGGADDLFLVDTETGRNSPIPRNAWEDVVGMFYGGAGSSEDDRRNTATGVITAVQGGASVNNAVPLALATNALADVLVTARVSPVERAMEGDIALASMIGGAVHKTLC